MAIESFQIRFQRQTNTNGALTEIFGTSSLREGTTLTGEDCTLALVDHTPSRGFGMGEVADFVVTIARSPMGDLALGIVGNWLYDVIKGKVRSLRRDGMTYKATAEDVKRLLDDAQGDQEDKDE